MPASKFLILMLLGIGTGMSGCNSKVSDVEEETSVDMRSIAVGMKMKEALAVLHASEINVQKISLGGVAIGEKDVWAQYVAKPSYESHDALVLLVFQEGKTSDGRIKALHWHLNYDLDFVLPKANRAERRLTLQSLDVSVLLPHDVVPASESVVDDSPF